jgi:anti-anti-sigma factor
LAAVDDPGLRLERRSEGARHTLTLTGELDLATVADLDGMIEQACSDGAAELVLELRGLSFMDSTGLSAILAAHERCAEHGCELLLTRPQRTVERLLELTGVIGRLRFLDPPAGS